MELRNKIDKRMEIAQFEFGVLNDLKELPVTKLCMHLFCGQKRTYFALNNFPVLLDNESPDSKTPNHRSIGNVGS